MMNVKKINWFGLAAGIILLFIVILAVVYASPWWQLTIGKGVGQANISPLSFNVTVLGSAIVIPLIWFFNLVCLLSFIAGAIAMLIYSVVPEKNYSKHLLNFAYKKPLIILILFLINLFISTYLIGTFTGVKIPLAGSIAVTLTIEDITMETSIAAGFTWVFGLAATAAVLCVAAKFYHKKIVYAPVTPLPAAPPPSA